MVRATVREPFRTIWQPIHPRPCAGARVCYLLELSQVTGWSAQVETLAPITTVRAEERAEPDNARMPPGTIVDHFRVGRLIGKGGMGEVYKARDLSLGRRVAIKLLHPQQFNSPESVSRFLTEARITAQFNHPNIVSIYHVGQFNGQPYMALEYLEGETLADRVARERLGVNEALRVTRAIALALDVAHGHGVLHRDLSSRNVLLGADGRVRLLDFGLAKYVAPEGELSDTGLLLSAPESVAGIKGSPAFMAPEQWRERQETSPATDSWALGVILYELLSGRRPFQAAEAQGLLVLGRTVSAPDPTPALPPVPGLPDPVQLLVAACLRKNPSERPTMSRVTAALDDLQLRRRRIPRGQRSPYPGLLPYGEGWEPYFFGRDSELSALAERLRLAPVCPVVGPSGTGKTSFVQAGLIPRLQDDQAWMVVESHPGEAPFEALATMLLAARGLKKGSAEWPAVQPQEPAGAAADGPEADDTRDTLTDLRGEPELATQLRQTPHALGLWLQYLAEVRGSRVLLVVDHLEELFALDGDDALPRDYLTALLSAAEDPAEPVRVVMILRDDLLGRLPGGPELRRALGQATVIGPPGRAALEQVVRGPLELVERPLAEPQLGAELVDAVAREQACLPLLSLTLSKLFSAPETAGPPLSRAALEQVGGVAGAVAAHAEEVVQGLPAEQVAMARDMLVRLVEPDRGRRVVARHHLLEGLPSGAAAALERLVRARLINTRKGNDGVDLCECELAHPSLARGWPRLARWLDEGQEDLRFVAEVSQAAELWKRRGLQREEVWRGEALERALSHAARLGAEVPLLARNFLAAGLEVQQRNQKVKRRWWLVILAGLLALVLVEAVVALAFRRKERQAVAERARAQLDGAREARTRGAVLEARARLRASLEAADSTGARALWWQLRSDPLRWQRRLGSFIYDVAVTADGAKVAAACQDRSVYLLDADTRRLRVLRGHEDQVFSVALSADGAVVASGGWDGEVRLWTPGEGAPRVLRGHVGAVWDLAFNPAGKQLVSAGEDGTVRVWDLKQARQVRRLGGAGGAVSCLAFDRAGQRLAAGSRDGKVRVFGSGDKPTRTLKAGRGGVLALAFSSDGEAVAAGDALGAVTLWGAGDSPRLRLRGHRGAVHNVTFAAGGKRLISGDAGGTIRTWEVATGRQLSSTEAHAQPVDGMALSQDGKVLVSGSRDRALKLWDAATLVRPKAADGAHGSEVFAADISPDDKQVASGGYDGTVRLWSAADGALLATLRGHGAGVHAVAFSRGGTLLASASRDHTVRLWRVPGGRLVRSLAGHQDAVYAARFSPDGRRVASAGADNTARIWAVASGKQLARLRHSDRVYALAFSPDGKVLATGGRGKKVRLWDARTGAPRGSPGSHTGSIRALAFSPVSGVLASAGEDRLLKLWGFQGAGSAGHTLGKHPGRIYALAFSPDGKKIGAAYADGTARLWAMAGGPPVVLRGHSAEVNELRFGRTGKLVVTAGDDQTVRLWDAATGQPRWRGPPRAATSKEVTRLRSSKPGLTAALTAGSWQVLGFGDGTIEAQAGGEAAGASLSFDSVPSSAVITLSPGPAHTIIAGQAGGLLGLWDMKSGALLRSTQLHGPVTAITLKDGTALTAKTALGDEARWDLGVFQQPYCALLRQVWQGVPVVWTGAPQPSVLAAPAGHQCGSED